LPQSGYEDALANLNTREVSRSSNSLLSLVPRDSSSASPTLSQLGDEIPDGSPPRGKANSSDAMETNISSSSQPPPSQTSTSSSPNSGEVLTGQRIREFIRLGKRPKAHKVPMEAWVSEQ